ncbi:MAG: hypothetical protein Q7J73_08090 [Dehalococcoidales bacterium]|nr:hypothetical protein [Dehalococcoidales bacterium]
MHITRVAAILFLGVTILAVACAAPVTPTSTQPVKPPPEPIASLPSEAPPVTPPAANVSPPSPPPVPNPSPAPALFRTPDTASGPYEFLIIGNKFVPGEILTNEGTTITWVNMDSVAHTIIPSRSSSNANIYVDPVTKVISINGNDFYGHLEPGGSTSITLMTAGYFYFYLEEDPNITGLIRV